MQMITDKMRQIREGRETYGVYEKTSYDGVPLIKVLIVFIRVAVDLLEIA